MDRFSLGIIIPAYNEQHSITNVVGSTLPFGQVIVVDDGSTDNTAHNATHAGAIVAKHAKNLGYDDALNSGFSKALSLGCTHVITFDADGQHQSEDIGRFINAFKKGNELVLGKRPTKQRFAELLFSFYTKFKFKANDPLCGMKGYNLNLYKSKGSFSSYFSIGTELMLYALKKNYQFSEIDITIKERYDKPRFGRTIRANFLILRAFIYSLFK